MQNNSTEKKRILVIDDTPADIHILLECLKEQYAVTVAKSGKKGLELAQIEPSPDIILLDVGMAEMDGYETCKRLKSNDKTQNIDVIFVSGHDTTEEKLKGYDVGGVDYVIKPVNPDELINKVTLCITNNEKQKSMLTEAKEFQSGFIEALTSAGEQGVLLRFLRQTFSATNALQLGNMIIEAVSSYQLSSTVQIRLYSERIHASLSNSTPPLEQELLFRLKDQGTIIEKNNRLIVNSKNVSLLIKNLPDSDEMKKGRLRDHLAILVEGASEKVEALMISQIEEERKNSLANLVNHSLDELRQIKDQHQKTHADYLKEMDTMLAEMENKFSELDLSDEQENDLINLIESSINRGLDRYEESRISDEKFERILNQFLQYGV